MPAFFACMAAALCFRAFLQYAIWKRTPQKKISLLQKLSILNLKTNKEEESKSQ